MLTWAMLVKMLLVCTERKHSATCCVNVAQRVAKLIEINFVVEMLMMLPSFVQSEIAILRKFQQVWGTMGQTLSYENYALSRDSVTISTINIL
jgi:hypothetical protein